MGILTELFLALKSINSLVKLLGELVLAVKDLKSDMIQKELETVRKEVNETLKQIENAQTKEERKKLAASINASMSR
jgi:hypothetical protein